MLDLPGAALRWLFIYSGGRLMPDQPDDELLSMTMTRDAADRFRAALEWASGQIASYAPPLTEKEKQTLGHGEWLRWGAGRVLAAGWEADKTARSTPTTEDSE